MIRINSEHFCLCFIDLGDLANKNALGEIRVIVIFEINILALNSNESKH